MLGEENARKSRSTWVLVGAFVAVFVGLYIFFRYVHPVVPWDGDDWETLGVKLVRSKTPYPVNKNVGSVRMFCPLSGAFCGYLAAFVVYPILGDYVLSIVTVNAFVLALTITISLIGVYYLFNRIAKGSLNIVMLGLGLYLLFAFLFLKTREGSAYLYWQFNLCTTYFYSVPSYLAGMFGIYIIIREVYKDEPWKLDLKTGLLIGAWYALNFSFLPAALLLAAISVMALLIRYIEQRNLKNLFINGWFFWMILVGSVVKVYFEIGKTFGSGYLKMEGSLLQKIKDSFLCLLKIFSEMNPLFCIAMGFFVLTAIWIRVKRGTESKEIDKTFLILTGAFVMLFMFFVLFGAISRSHLYKGIPRIDTLYVLYFLMILIAALSAVYVLKNNKHLLAAVPLLMVLMIFTVVSPRNGYSDSYYMDSTPAQRIEIMQKVVEEAQRRDVNGEPGFIVHMPRIGHYNGGLSEAMFYHNITNKKMPITFSYEDRIDISFEDYIP